MNEQAVVEEATDEGLEADQTLETDLENEETPELEEWQKVEDEEAEADYQVDGKLHQNMKSKFKSRIVKRDEELEKLRAENEALKAKREKANEPLTRPKIGDFNGDDEAFYEALDDYNDKRTIETINRSKIETTQTQAQQQAKQKQAERVNDHYSRMDNLITEHKMPEDKVLAADKIIKGAFETVSPGSGELIAEQIFAVLGKGSEKVAYSLSVNPARMNQVIDLFKKDPSGLRLASYLGSLKAQLTNPKKPRTKAPDPAADLHGDEKPTALTGGKFLKAYKKADEGQARYDIKKAAKAAGVDTSKW